MTKVDLPFFFVLATILQQEELENKKKDRSPFSKARIQLLPKHKFYILEKAK